MELNFNYTFDTVWELFKEFWWAFLGVGIFMTVLIFALIDGDVGRWLETPIANITIVDALVMLLIYEVLIRD